ncbi:glycosyltransferase family 4 protein [Staphylothermus hellenicus]|uniref:Glycosyl transferase group 1 n=1 Tax=Staphylothermus hellenicus (strain DSM 12710 / JCM 10830 / BK20S6-10-b1 / P8) TaxID=591019 RepID=D7D896_STAHD|nr:glycosyltransferase family 4 protein [Staphylothermus hellenicus]ADI31992.1 glycosyl transferase group 1 [Staphylothermus hellenicus DSM 12710]
MRILYVAPRYHPHIGGVEYVVESLATRFAKMGHQVTVLCGEPGTDKPVEEELNNVRVIRWPTLAPNNAYHIPRQKAEFEKILEELAKTHDVAHIHSAHAVLPVHAGLRLKQCNPSLRLVFTPHYHGTGHTLTRRLLWNIFWRSRVNKLTQTADIIHSVSPYEAQLLQKHYPHIRHKIIVIPNGVDEDVLNYKWKGQNSDYMIYAGRIEKYKRLELAVNLAKQLGLRLIILGNGPHKNKLKEYAEKYYLGKVEFHPPQPRQTYLRLLASSRYAVNLSKHEAYSIFIAESLAIGVPAIVTEVILRTLQPKPINILNLNREKLFIAQSFNATPWNATALKIKQIYE